MQIAIRMDDITPDMDWEKFLKFKKLLDEHDIKPLIGVVPDNKDKKLSLNKEKEDFWDYVKHLQQDGWTVAMHGLNHLYTTKNPGLFPIGNKSEFAGLSFRRQDEMIREGKEILFNHGIVTDIFMAPSHSFDKNTIRALKNNGFYVITDGFGTTPFRSLDMVFYPISVVRSKSLSDASDGIVTFVYHANTMEDKDFEALKKLLESGKATSYSDFRRADIIDRNIAGDVKQFMTAKAKYTAVQLRKLRG